MCARVAAATVVTLQAMQFQAFGSRELLATVAANNGEQRGMLSAASLAGDKFSVITEEYETGRKPCTHSPHDFRRNDP